VNSAFFAPKQQYPIPDITSSFLCSADKYEVQQSAAPLASQSHARSFTDPSHNLTEKYHRHQSVASVIFQIFKGIILQA
jgi:hypothetical protein